MWIGTFFLFIGTTIGVGLALRKLAKRFDIQVPTVHPVERIITFLGFRSLCWSSHTSISCLLRWPGLCGRRYCFWPSSLSFRPFSTGIVVLALVLCFVLFGEPKGLFTHLKRLEITFIIIELVFLVIFLVWPAWRPRLC